MKILSESGLVNSRRDGVWMKYTINKEGLDLLKNLFDHIDKKLLKQVYLKTKLGVEYFMIILKWLNSQLLKMEWLLI